MAHLHRLASPRRLRRWGVRLGVLVLLAPAWLLGHAAMLVIAGAPDSPVASDIAVVFGNGVQPDGTPGDVLRARLERTVRLWEDGLTDTILVSGSRGPNGYDEPAAMRRFLERAGVPSSVIIEDGAGNNTFLTALNTTELMAERGASRVTVVSQFWHVPRIKLAFAKFGVTDVISAPTDEMVVKEDAERITREFFGFYWYLVRDHPTPSVAAATR